LAGQWSGINTTLQEYSYDLAALNDATQIIFRFHFASDPAVDGEGALIDDFVIDGVVATEEEQFANLVTLYPNPSEGYFNINWPHSEKAVMHILDMTGKKIRSESIEAEEPKHLMLKICLNGMYVLQFQTSKMTFSKKLIIQ
jgi:hypothetical protein